MNQPWVDKSVRVQGVILVLISAVVFSSAGLFTKGVSADSWAIIFWRSLFAIIFMVGFIAWKGSWKAQFSRMGKSGWAAALVGALATCAFIPAFKHTTIANVALLWAAAPFVAALIAWIWMREKPEKPVLLGSVLALTGVGVIVSGSVGSLNLKGDVLALLMVLGMSMWMVIYRRYPETPSTGPNVFMCVILMIISLVAGDPLNAPVNEIPIMAAFGLVFSVAAVTMTEGAKRLPPAEVALIGALETPLAPIWAVMMFDEWPTILAIYGGIIVLIAVFGSQLMQMKNRKI